MHNNKPTPSPVRTNCQLNISVYGGDGADVELKTDLDGSFDFEQTMKDPPRFVLILKTAGGTGGSVFIKKDGYTPIIHRLQNFDGSDLVIPMSGAWELHPETITPLLPPDYSRQRALGMNTSFMGGLIIPSPSFGLMPWWDAALAWCDEPTRKLVYAAKKAGLATNGVPETHCLLDIPCGVPLYNEAGQYYSPDRFGPIDWTNGETNLNADFDNLIKEILENGFAFHIAVDERMEHSKRLIPLVAQRLKDLGITKDGFTMPGFDGVFYGWDPGDIADWAATARAINNDILLGLEFTHLPLGEGAPVSDYNPTAGRMKDFDIILSEATGWTPGITNPDDTTWQIVGRCIHPYNRPADEPSSDDPRPPFVLLDSSRGPRFFNYFETDEPYRWVRVNPNDTNAVNAEIARLNGIRNYVRNLGVEYTG